MYTPLGIRFNDCFFSEPVSLASWTPPRFSGLFVILACDANWAPIPFQPLCFGEFGNNATHPLSANGYSWLGPADRKKLFVSVLPMPFSTSAQRAAVRSQLVAAYNPVFQAHGAAESGPLECRMAEMERRHQEHAEKVLLLLGNIHKHFEPQPVPEHRRIGFLPESLPELR